MPAPKPTERLLTDAEVDPRELVDLQRRFHSEVVADYEMGGDRKFPPSREKNHSWNLLDLFGKRTLRQDRP